MKAVGFTAVDSLLIILLLSLLCFSLAVVALEEALSRLNRVRVEALAETVGTKKVASLNRLVTSSHVTRNALRLLGLLSQLFQTALVTFLAIKFFLPPWSALAVVLNIIFVFVIAESVPRTLAILHADAVALALARPLDVLLRALPMRFASQLLIRLTNAIVPGGGLQQGPFSLPEEFLALADVAVEDEVLEPQERDLIESVIEFGDTIVREVMMPRTDMTTIVSSLRVADALQEATAVGFSRLPVVEENVDDVVGLIYVKDLIKADIAGSSDEPIQSLLRPSRFVPETKKVAELLKEMQQEKFHMAIAVDEYGGIAGLVTLEDLIEEIVGEIVDEYDTEEPLVERQLDGTLEVDARIMVDELNDLAGTTLPTGPWDTVGGLVFDTFGRVPGKGETCTFSDCVLKVVRLQGRRITRIQLKNIESASAEGDEDST